MFVFPYVSTVLIDSLSYQRGRLFVSQKILHAVALRIKKKQSQFILQYFFYILFIYLEIVLHHQIKKHTQRSNK